MSDLVTPGEVDAEVDNTSAGNAWAKSSVGGWVVDGVDLAGIYSALDETVLNAFAHASSSGLDVIIDPGEAYVGGWLCRDTQTTVTLPASSTTTVYLGYDASAILASGEAPADNPNIIVGLDGDFSGEDPRIPIYEFTTDSTSVTGSTDLRLLKKPVDVDHSAGETVVSTDLRVEGSVVGGLGVTGSVTASGTVKADDEVEIRSASDITNIRFGRTDASGSIHLAGHIDNADAIGSRTIGISGSATDTTPEHQFSAASGDAYHQGDLTVGSDITLESGNFWATAANPEDHVVRAYATADKRATLRGVDSDSSGTIDYMHFYGWDESINDRLPLRLASFVQLDAVNEVMTVSSREVLTEQSAWDGSSMIIRTESGTEIRFTSEE